MIQQPQQTPPAPKHFHLLPVPVPALPDWQRRVADWVRS